MRIPGVCVCVSRTNCSSSSVSAEVGFLGETGVWSGAGEKIGAGDVGGSLSGDEVRGLGVILMLSRVFSLNNRLFSSCGELAAMAR